MGKCCGTECNISDPAGKSRQGDKQFCLFEWLLWSWEKWSGRRW